jgi:hypothetical protein
VHEWELGKLAGSNLSLSIGGMSHSWLGIYDVREWEFSRTTGRFVVEWVVFVVGECRVSPGLGCQGDLGHRSSLP